MADIEKLLTFDKNVTEKAINAVFSEEKNDAHRYNPFFLVQTTPILDKAIQQDYETSDPFKKITR